MYPTTQSDSAVPVSRVGAFWSFGAGALILLATFGIAWRQGSQPPSLNPPDSRTHWFLHPIERNPERRLPAIGADLRDVHFVNAEQGWVVGNEGTILATRDGGATWQLQTSGTTGDLRSVHFFNASQGWAVSDRGTILATHDGGTTWQPQNSGPATYLTSVHFLNAEQGWAVGSGGTILSTRDGGKTWLPQTTTTEVLTSVNFLNADQGWTVGTGGTILFTRNGGKTWQPQNSSTTDNLLSVQFLNAEQGWAVGSRSTVLSTRDGGTSWQPQTSSSTQSLLSVQFLNADQGWAVGTRGTILFTRDGGTTWQPQASGTTQNLTSVQFLNADQGWTVGTGGTILFTRDGGKTWQPQAGTTQHLRSVHFPNADQGWTGGYEGTILSTRDGGKTWQPQTSGTRGWLHSVHFLNANQGWAVGSGGTILFTRDGGKTWQPQASGTTQELRSVHFLNAEQGWAVGTGTVLSTGDGGTTWQPQPSGTSQDPFSVHFLNASQGWTVGTFGTILSTRDGGRTWQPQNSGNRQTLFSVHFLNVEQGWTVGSGGTILSTYDGGKTWQRRTSGTIEDLYSVDFPNAEQGWAVGYRGTILSTRDGGKSWQPQTSGTTQRLSSVHFLNAEQGWIVGDGGTILFTRDGGKTWQHPTNRILPAPWIWITVPLGLVLLGQAMRSLRTPIREPARNAANRAVNDAPITAHAQDQLNYSNLALGLAEFFRNRNTEPPVTVTIQGPWGSGKSSVMRMTETQLRRNGFPTVWFNPWHHETESQMLAYLLEAIRKQGVPHGWENLRFRCMLLLARSRKISFWFVAGLLFLVAGLAGLGVVGANQWYEWFRNFEPARAVQGGAVLSTIFGAVTVLKWLWKSLETFNVKPADLLRTAAGKTSRENASFRTDFQQQFAEVTHALHPLRMAIFIDDLDRCQPDRVRQVLESINFLTSAGPCFIVLGLARDIVEASVGLGFAEIAKEMTTDRDADDRKARREYARRYLQKLINLPVDLPEPAEADLARVATEDLPNAPNDPRWPGLLTRAASLVLVGSLVFGAWTLGTRLPAPPPDSPPKATAAPHAPTPESPQPPVGKGVTKGDPLTKQEQPASGGFTPPDPDDRHWWAYWMTPIVVLGSLLVLLGLTAKPNRIVDDSDTFKEALALWSRLFPPILGTPREVKRLVNQIRFRAIRARGPLPEISWWDAVRGRKPIQSKAAGLREADLVREIVLEKGSVRDSV